MAKPTTVIGIKQVDTTNYATIAHWMEVNHLTVTDLPKYAVVYDDGSYVILKSHHDENGDTVFDSLHHYTNGVAHPAEVSFGMHYTMSYYKDGRVEIS